MKYDPLIYGRDQTEGIVGIEIENDTSTLFIQKDGQITTKQVPNKFWILTNNSSSNWARLKGDLHYKFGKQFDSREEFEETRNKLRRYDTYSIWDAKEAFCVKEGYTWFKGMSPEDVSVLSFDIETTSLEFTNKDKVLLISSTFRNQGKIERRLFSYDDYSNDGEMIDDWCKWVREKNPSILLGHNIVSFDLIYLNDCIKKYGFEGLSLGRNGSILQFARYESKFRKDQTQFLSYKKPACYGRQIIDTYFLSIRYDVVAKKYNSYGLKNIIAVEGLEEKDRVFYDASKIRYNYTIEDEWEKIKKYCETDSDDSLKLYDLMAPPYFYMTQSIPKSFQEVICGASGSQINSMMIRSYLQQGYSIPKASETTDFQGAVSFAVPGIYRNVLKLDFNALYPSILREYKVYDEHKDPNAYLLKMVEYFAIERLKNKKLAKETGIKYYDDLQNAQKIFANSFYGFLSTNGLNFNSPKKAAFITQKGRELLEISIRWATGQSTQYWIQLFEEKTK